MVEGPLTESRPAVAHRTFPSGTAYSEALQDPSACLSDPALATGEVTTSSLGLPRPISGNVASVFRITTADGRTWALRCFVRWPDDQALRYAAISEALTEVTDPWRVGFELQPRGIEVDGEWFPVVKMAWSEATPLVQYVEAHLWDRTALSYLAVRVAELATRLRVLGLAHGDLQHGNILVAPGGDLRLIDYDGMWVPALAGRVGTELGHRNYSHPGRTRTGFGPHIDAFPSWVIYASLVALAVDPLLWGRLDGGDECLLFRAADFARPEQSEALRCFEASGDARLQRLSGRLRQFLASPADRVPTLGFPLDVPPPLDELAGTDATELAERKRLFALLLSTHPGGATVVSLAPAGPEPGVSAPTGDEIVVRPDPPALAPVHFGPAIRRARLQMVLPSAAVVALLAAGLTSIVPVGVALGLMVVCALGWVALAHASYDRMPELDAARAATRELVRHRQAAAGADRTVADLQGRRDAAGAGEADATDGFQQAALDGQREEQAARRAIDERLRVRLAELAAREQELIRQEQRVLTDALEAAQAEALRRELESVRLARASLPGVDDSVIYALALDDIRTAGDFLDVRVEGGRSKSDPGRVVLLRADGREVRVSRLTSVQGQALLAWRQTQADKVRHLLPAGLAPAATAELRAPFEAAREAVRAEQAAARDAAVREGEAVRDRAQAAEPPRSEALQEAQRAAAGARLELDTALNRARKDAAEAHWRLAAAQRDVEAHGDLSFAAFLRALAGRA